jgi:hypothetical protein
MQRTRPRLDIFMKEIIAAAIVAAMSASAASAATRHVRAPQHYNLEERGGGPYESTSQGHQSYPNPDRQPFVTQFGRPD